MFVAQAYLRTRGYIVNTGWTAVTALSTAYFRRLAEQPRNARRELELVVWQQS